MPGIGTILIVDDDADVAGMVAGQLEREGYDSETVHDGKAALAVVRRHSPDLILLDRVLPRMGGDEVVRCLRSDPRTRAIPIIMLTGKSDESDQLVGLALGADDYISKPFSIKLLLARVAALLRRKNIVEQRDEVITAKSITLDRDQTQVFVDKTPVQLTATEYKLLATLIAARGHILASRQLAYLVFGKTTAHGDRGIDGQVEGLRRKMGPAAGCIQSVTGGGYAFCRPAGQRPSA